MRENLREALQRATAVCVESPVSPHAIQEADNYSCDGSGPHTPGEVRILPLGASGNLILCHACFDREIRYRRNQVGLGTWDTADLPTWEESPVYRAEGVLSVRGAFLTEAEGGSRGDKEDGEPNRPEDDKDLDEGWPDDSYEGWSNQVTWAVNLDVMNTFDLYQLAMSGKPWDVAGAQEFVRTAVAQGKLPDVPNVAALYGVNWEELIADWNIEE